jgi:hypothetical protein
MTDQSPPEQSANSPELLRGMAATGGVILTPERAATLGRQAEEHFALLSHLEGIANSRTEPAAELRLDCWTTSGSA